MSQFSQKYYKHYHVGKKKEVVSDEFDFWEWSRKYRFFEMIIIFLLLLILFCLCYRYPVSQQGMLVYKAQTSNIQDIKVDETIHKNDSKEEQKLKEEQRQKKQEQALTLQEKIPKRVLPELSKLIPKKEVTLEEYMYYVNDTKQGYPNYVDSSTNRMIKERRGSCKTVECSVSAITQEDKAQYAQWLSEQGSINYRVVDNGSSFRVVSE